MGTLPPLRFMPSSTCVFHTQEGRESYVHPWLFTGDEPRWHQYLYFQILLLLPLCLLSSAYYSLLAASGLLGSPPALLPFTKVCKNRSSQLLASYLTCNYKHSHCIHNCCWSQIFSQHKQPDLWPSVWNSVPVTQYWTCCRFSLVNSRKP